MYAEFQLHGPSSFGEAVYMFYKMAGMAAILKFGSGSNGLNLKDLIGPKKSAEFQQYPLRNIRLRSIFINFKHVPC